MAIWEYLVYGFIAVSVGAGITGVAFGVGAAGSGLIVGIAVGGLAAFVGTMFVMVGLVAKGVEVGTRGS